MSGISSSRVRFPSGIFKIFKTGAASILASFDLTNLTASRTITLPDKAGTMAMMSDVTGASAQLDGTFEIDNTASPTKVLKFSAGSITAGQTRTMTAPDRSTQFGGVDLWATATKYIVGDVIAVSYLGSIRAYRCTTAHTAGATFAGDVANWTFLGALQFEAAAFGIMQTADPTKLVTFDPSSITASRAVTIPDKSGTMAMTSDITAGSLADTQFLYRQSVRNSNFDYFNASGSFAAPATDTEVFSEFFAIKTAGAGTAPSITFTKDNSTLPDKKSSYVMKANVTATGSASSTTEGGFYFYVRDFEKYQSRSISFSMYMLAPVASELVEIAVYDGVTTTLKSLKTLTTGWVLYKYENISIASAATQIKISIRLAGGTGLTVPSASNFVPANTGAFYFAQAQINDGTSAITYQPPILKSGKGSYIRRQNGLTRGATNTKVIIYGTAVESFGDDITYVNSAANGDGFLANTSGIYSVSVSVEDTTTSQNLEIRVGASLDNNEADAKTRQTGANIASLGYTNLTWIGYVPAGNYIWVVASNAPTGSVYRNQISVAKVANFD
jgi:hypothetical protein